MTCLVYKRSTLEENTNTVKSSSITQTGTDVAGYFESWLQMTMKCSVPLITTKMAIEFYRKTQPSSAVMATIITDTSLYYFTVKAIFTVESLMHGVSISTVVFDDF